MLLLLTFCLLWTRFYCCFFFVQRFHILGLECIEEVSDRVFPKRITKCIRWVDLVRRNDW